VTAFVRDDRDILIALRVSEGAYWERWGSPLLGLSRCDYALYDWLSEQGGEEPGSASGKDRIGFIQKFDEDGDEELRILDRGSIGHGGGMSLRCIPAAIFLCAPRLGERLRVYRKEVRRRLYQ